MKVFTCTTFRGHWPVGTAAVVVAVDAAQAESALRKMLEKHGLPQDGEELVMVEVDTRTEAVIILRDGDY